VVKALDYKPEGRGFETHELKFFRPHWALGFTQPLTEMSTGNINKNSVSGESSAAGAWG
jgi:hypothetical protein